MDGGQHQQGRGQGDQHVGAQARGPAAILALEADYAAGDQRAEDGRKSEGASASMRAVTVGKRR
jgi:hypothetical protein